VRPDCHVVAQARRRGELGGLRPFDRFGRCSTNTAPRATTRGGLTWSSAASLAAFSTPGPGRQGCAVPGAWSPGRRGRGDRPGAQLVVISPLGAWQEHPQHGSGRRGRAHRPRATGCAGERRGRWPTRSRTLLGERARVAAYACHATCPAGAVTQGCGATPQRLDTSVHTSHRPRQVNRFHLLTALVLAAVLALTLSTVQPASASTYSVNRLRYSTGTSTQIIVVSAGGYRTSYATLETFYKDRYGHWQRAFAPMAARIGYNGFAPPGAKREGDGRQSFFCRSVASLLQPGPRRPREPGLEGFLGLARLSHGDWRHHRKCVVPRSALGADLFERMGMSDASYGQGSGSSDPRWGPTTPTGSPRRLASRTPGCRPRPLCC